MSRKSKPHDAVNGYIQAIFPKRRSSSTKLNLAAAAEEAKKQSPQYQKGFRLGLQDRNQILKSLREKRKHGTKSLKK